MRCTGCEVRPSLGESLWKLTCVSVGCTVCCNSLLSTLPSTDTYLSAKCMGLLCFCCCWARPSGRTNVNERETTQRRGARLREGFFLAPVSPPVHFDGAKIAFFSGRAISEQHLSERAVLRTACVYGRTCAQLWGAVYVFMYCAPVYTSI